MALFAPYVAEELWHDFGGDGSVHIAPWPAFDEKKIVGDTATIVVQINGKIRDSFEVKMSEDESSILTRALGRREVTKWMDGKKLRKTVYIKGKLLSIVVG